MKPSKMVSAVGLVVFASFLALALWIFALVQLLPPGDAWLSSAIPFRGFYGDAQMFPGISYTAGLEASGFISFAGMFAYGYGGRGLLPPVPRVLGALAAPLRLFGVLIALIVYTETHLFWGEIWYGVKFLNLSPMGFPWGNERVASNTCFFYGSDYVSSLGSNCWFFNYDQLLLVSLVAATAGFALSRWADSKIATAASPTPEHQNGKKLGKETPMV